MIGQDRKMVQAIMKMKPVSYSGRESKLQNIHQRMMTGRGQFENIIDSTLGSTMSMSAIDLEIMDKMDRLADVSHDVKKSVDNINEFTGITARIASEVAEAHVSLTKNIEEVSNTSEDILKKINHSEDELGKVMSLSDETITDSKEMKSDMSELMNIIGSMNEVIMAINAISSQTNLLALNASIEAARAGEAGKGFAVVAEQIRLLADETKNLTNNMGEFVGKISSASEKSAKSVDTTVSALETIHVSMDSVWKRNSENREAVKEVTDTMLTVASTSEEVCSSFQDVVEQLRAVSEESNSLKSDALELEEVRNKVHQAVEPVRNVENRLDKMAKLLGKMSEDTFYMPENKLFVTFVNNAITAHTKWLTVLKTMVDTQNIMPLQTDDTKCGFGHFYYSMSPKQKSVQDVWGGLGGKHRTFHDYAVHVMDSIRKGKEGEARKLYEDAEKLSVELIADFKKIIAATEQLDKAGIRVFE